LTEVIPTYYNKSGISTGSLSGLTTGASPIQGNWLGATVPGYNAYIISGFVRYDF